MPEKYGLRRNETHSLPGWRPIRKLAIPFQVAADVERFDGGFREAWWSASHLLHQIGTWRDLAVGDLQEGRQGEHTRAYPEVDS